MKGFKIFTLDYWGCEGNEIFYTTNYSIAVEKFNYLLRKTIKEYDVIEKNDFGEQVHDFKDFNDFKSGKIEIICRKCPFIIYKDDNKYIARVYYWDKTSYEYEEYDIRLIDVKIEEIEIIEE